MCRTLHTPLATGLTEVIFVKALVTTSLFYIGKIYRLVDNLSLQIKLVAIVVSLEVLWQFGPFKMWHICEQQGDSKKQKFLFFIGPTSHFIPLCKRIIHAKFQKIWKKFRGCYQRSKFCMGSLWDFLVQFDTPCFWQVNIHFVLYFPHCCSIWLLPIQITIFSNKGCFWSPKIAKNNKTLQIEDNHCMALL